MKTSNNFRIIASMDDYHSARNARFNTRPLINKIGCIEYRLWDDGLTKEQALEQFKSWAAESCFWYDEEMIAEEAAQFRADWAEAAGIKADEGMSEYSADDWKQANRWYEGPGWYNGGGQRVWDGKSLTYTEDIWTWTIEEA